MYRIVFESSAVMVTENDHGMVLANRGESAEWSVFWPHVSGMPERFHANVDVLSAVWTDEEADGGPKLDAEGFTSAMDEYVRDVIAAYNLVTGPADLAEFSRRLGVSPEAPAEGVEDAGALARRLLVMGE